VSCDVCCRILKVLCRDLRLGSEFDFGQLAHNTPGYVGADLMALAREAAITAVNRSGQRSCLLAMLNCFIESVVD